MGIGSSTLSESNTLPLHPSQWESRVKLNGSLITVEEWRIVMAYIEERVGDLQVNRDTAPRFIADLIDINNSLLNETDHENDSISENIQIHIALAIRDRLKGRYLFQGPSQRTQNPGHYSTIAMLYLMSLIFAGPDLTYGDEQYSVGIKLDLLRRIGKIYLERRLAEGCCGVVRPILDTFVCKFPADHPKAVSHLNKEVASLQTLKTLLCNNNSNSNISTLFSFPIVCYTGEAPELYFWQARCDLFQYCKQLRSHKTAEINNDNVVTWMVGSLLMQMGSALDAMHEKGWCHGDFKLGNVLIDKNDQLLLTDFDAAHFVDGNSTLYDSHEFLNRFCTLYYVGYSIGHYRLTRHGGFRNAREALITQDLWALMVTCYMGVNMISLNEKGYSLLHIEGEMENTALCGSFMQHHCNYNTKVSERLDNSDDIEIKAQFNQLCQEVFESEIEALNTFVLLPSHCLTSPYQSQVDEAEEYKQGAGDIVEEDINNGISFSSRRIS